MASDITTWEDALDNALAEVRATMIERHKKYGPGNIAAFGTYGLIVRLSDKMERLKNLLRKSDPFTDALADIHSDESIEDTFTDITGYGLISKMWHRKQWHLPMEDEAD